MRRILVVTVLSLSVAIGSIAAQDDDHVWTGVSRIVAIGDVHGAYDNLVKVLQNAKLIDDKLRWIGGEAHLVQNGDLVDRGPDSRKVMDFLMKLEERAEDEGGRVHVLIGNHEAMNIVGILDLVSEKEYEAFIDRDSRKRSEQAFDRYYDDLRREARERGEQAPTKNAAKIEFTETYPLGFIEHRRAFGPDGRYGKWILQHDTSVVINNILFSHGDWSEKFAEIGIAEVNDRVRKELAGKLEIVDGLTFDEASPLQYRGLANTALNVSVHEQEQARIDAILARLGVTRMVVGHMLTPGWIESRFNGKHLSLDVGMLEIYRGGHRVALELEGDSLRAVHDFGTVDVPAVMDEAALNEYVTAVAAVDPENLDAQLKLVDILREQGRASEAMPILVKLFEEPEYVPFRYRDVLGGYYEELGNEDEARTQYRAYVDGISTLVAKNADNTNLANLMARYCVDKGIELDRALDAIRQAHERDPDNYGFIITLSRVLLAKNDYALALEALQRKEPPPGFTYESHLYEGMAHTGLGQTDRARASFGAAIALDSERREAKDALSRLDEP